MMLLLDAVILLSAYPPARPSRTPRQPGTRIVVKLPFVGNVAMQLQKVPPAALEVVPDDRFVNVVATLVAAPCDPLNGLVRKRPTAGRRLVPVPLDPAMTTIFMPPPPPPPSPPRP